ncbi:hypothetical protein B9Z55_025363 [Caenorhabditis nigoni]|uniref:NTF2-like domain-containing protein n=1 Tax=Caenorhabditis nigoni TaxID=1611254 RepID=A0A2G5SYB0_9PELO|nr:hypothetical protein B9Z55_025363 [Caenorhabditis nigoni]
MSLKFLLMQNFLCLLLIISGISDANPTFDRRGSDPDYNKVYGDFHVPRRHRHRYPHRDCIFVIPDDCDGPVNESEKDITDFLSTVLKKGFTYKGCEDTFDKEGIIGNVKDIEDNEDLYWDITTVQVRNTTADLIVEVTLGKSILMKAKAVFDLDDEEFVSAEAVGCKNNKEEESVA